MALTNRWNFEVLNLEARVTPAADLQIIHNSPYASVGTVDVWVNDTKTLNDVSFQQSTPFLSLPDGTPLKIDIVAGTATNNKSPVFTQTVTLTKNSTNIAIAVGDPADSTTNQKFGLAITTAARQTSTSVGNVQLLFQNGSPDAPAVDARIRGAGSLGNDLVFKSYGPDYATLAPGQYILDIQQKDGLTPIRSYKLDLSDAAGATRTLTTSGFLTLPTATSPAFALLSVDKLGNGTLPNRARPFGEADYAAGAVGKATLFTQDGTARFSVSPFASGVVVRTAAADVTGDGNADLVVGSGPGIPSAVQVYDGVTQKLVQSYSPFEVAFTGGVFVASADMDGDGFADLAITPDQGGGPRVQLISGKTTKQFIGDFLGIDDPAFRGGARTAFGDVNNDNTLDLIVSAGFSGGPRVAVFHGNTLRPGGVPGRLTPDFFVFERALNNGAYVAAGDVDGDGFADLIAGGGPGGGPRVQIFSGKTLVPGASTQAVLANFFAGDVNNRDGVRLAAKDFDGDLRSDIVVGLGSPGVAQVRTFLGKNLTTAVAERNPFDASLTKLGVFVG
ncbi:MAG: DUF4397 domain-containing protein [Fimbriiglobus sp.]